MTEKTASIVLGGGCFWCLEAVFETIPGVRRVVSGYAGGKTPDPTYESVCSGTTGHAEVVKVDFDPDVVSPGELLEKFWQCHDPTTPDRQGADVGSQYRSVILYADDAQREIAENSRERAATRFNDPIVTEIAPLDRFHEAEAYHQGYYRNNPSAPYCLFVIRPKLEK